MDFHFPSLVPWPRLAPGEIYIPRYRYDQDYYSLFFWGYGNGQLPVGRYEIIAHPDGWLGGHFIKGQTFSVDPSVTSNVVTVDVQP